MVDVLHSETRTNRIWTNKPVYRDSRVGNLGKTRFGEVLSFPLQHGFDSDSKRGFPITVHDHTTPLASVKSVVAGVMSVVHCTAVGTPFGSVVSVNNLKRDTELFTVRFKKFSESSVRNAVNLSIALFVKLVFSPSDAELFNGDGSIVRLSKVQNFFDNLTASGFDEISLFVFKLLEVFLSFSRAVVGVALKFLSPFKIFPLFLSYISSKVKLPLHFRSLSVKDSYGGKRVRTNIDADDKSSVILWLRKLLFKDNSNPATSQKQDVAKAPSIVKEGVESFELIVKFNRNCKGLTRRISDLKTWVSSFGLEKFEPSFIKPNGTSLKPIINCLSFSPHIFSCFLNYVRGQKGGLAYVEIC